MFENNINLILILYFLILLLVLHAVYIQKRLNRLLRGKNMKSLEDVFLMLQNKLKENENLSRENTNSINKINDKIKSRVKSVKTLRFKPFEDAGSTQSFAIAIIDEDENGVVLSSLYTRERMSVFAKPINKGISEYELTNEEKSVLESAKQD